MTAATLCTWPPCARTTQDPSGRCPYHRGRTAPPVVKATVPTPTPAVTGSSNYPSLGSVPDGWERSTRELGRQVFSRVRDFPGEDLPSQVGYDPGGALMFEEWRSGGQLSRESAPARITYELYDRVVAREEWYLDGKLHRLDGPAEVRYREGSPIREIYHRDGKTYRPEGPTSVLYFPGGSVREEVYHDAEEHLHRVDGPAKITYREDGSILREEFHRDGVLSREDGPAVIIRNPSGLPTEEEYWYRNNRHRSDGPAVITYDSTGTRVTSLNYFVQDGHHRLDGPAVIGYDDAGNETETRYAYRGSRRVETPAEFAELLLDDQKHGGARDLRRHFVVSPLAPLIEEKRSIESVVSGIGEGLRTVDGIRAYLDGAPAEWARSFEESTR